MNYTAYDKKMTKLENQLSEAKSEKEKGKITKAIIKLEQTADIGLF